jgi:hypothetical protein
VKAVPGTTSAFAERITGGFYLNIEPDREQLARYGLAVGEVLDVIGTALGGEMVTTTVEGRERFGVTVRYPRELRSRPAADRQRGAGAHHGWRHDSAGAGGQGGRWPRVRPASAPRTRCCRPTSSWTSATATSAAMWPTPRRPWRAGEVSARLLRHLERPVRIHGARHREDEGRDPGHAAHPSSCCCT